ncbi:hypothetical protein GLOTRDRAFT_97310, partial [Gloeophyllum trabeum ATCC 11539]
AFKESDEGFPTLLRPGNARKVEETRNTILSHMIMATHAAAEKPIKEAVSSSGVKDSFATPIISRLIQTGKVLRKSNEQRKAVSPEEVNRILTEELKKHKDRPMMNPLLQLDGKFTEFQSRLNSLNQRGLNVPNIMADYMCRYSGGLIGKHFKTISQVMTFAIAGIAEKKLQDAWDAIGRLTVLIWTVDIPDLESHLEELKKTINDVLDSAASCSPALITNKPKPHILAHIIEDVRRFGPAILFSTERYEKFNRVFRLCSIHSNRQAPSRDIATMFAHQDRCRHVVTGGFWFDRKLKRWVCAGRSVIEHINTHAQDAALLGVSAVTPFCAGATTLFPLPKGVHIRPPPLKWKDTATYKALGDAILQPPSGAWQPARTFVTASGDTAAIGDQHLGVTRSLGFARVREILSAASDSSTSCAVVEESQLEFEVHPTLQLPVIRTTGIVSTVPLHRILAIVNVQHDCLRGACKTTSSVTVRQEREETTRTKSIVKHTEYPYYLLNIYSLHNNNIIREAVPLHLRSRPPLYLDRHELHISAAASLRDEKLQKKLAKEAAIRKQAETARLAANLPGLLDDVEVIDDEADEETWDQPSLSDATKSALTPAIRTNGTDQNPAPTEQPVMRGPRGRRGNANAPRSTGQPSTRGRGRGKKFQAGASSATGPMIPPSPPPATRVAGTADTSTSLRASTSLPQVQAAVINAPHNAPSKKRRRAAADPVAAAAREAELRTIQSTCSIALVQRARSQILLNGRFPPATALRMMAFNRDEFLRRYGLSLDNQAVSGTSGPTLPAVGSGHDTSFASPTMNTRPEQVFTPSAGSPFLSGLQHDAATPQRAETPGEDSFTAQSSNSASSDPTQSYRRDMFDGTDNLWNSSPMPASMGSVPLRRQRDEQDMSVDGSRARMPMHQNRVFAKQRCESVQLSHAQMQKVQEFAELSVVEMLIDLKIHLIQNELELIKRFFKSYYRHPDFVTRLRTHLAAALLAPNVRAYVKGMTDQMV